MKYYLDSKDESVQGVYITDVDVNSSTKNKKTYRITYANGEVEDNVLYTESNDERIEERLKEQVRSGEEVSYKLTRQKVVGTIGRILTGTLLSAGTYSALNAANFDATIDNPAILVGASGVVFLGGILLGVKNYLQTQSTLNELQDNVDRLDQTEEAKKYLESSPNAYRALNGDVTDDKISRTGQIFDMLQEGRDPFSFLALETGEGLTNEEVSNLIKRSQREEELGLAYTDGYSYSAVSKSNKK